MLKLLSLIHGSISAVLLYLVVWQRSVAWTFFSGAANATFGPTSSVAYSQVLSAVRRRA